MKSYRLTLAAEAICLRYGVSSLRTISLPLTNSKLIFLPLVNALPTAQTSDIFVVTSPTSQSASSQCAART